MSQFCATRPPPPQTPVSEGVAMANKALNVNPDPGGGGTTGVRHIQWCKIVLFPPIMLKYHIKNHCQVLKVSFF